MSKSTKSQFYRYTLRTVASAAPVGCTDKMFLYPVPPEDAISIEGLFTHFRFTFDSSVPAADRKVLWMAVASERPLFNADEPTRCNKLILDAAADGNRRVDLKLDLTDLLIPENVAFTPLLSADYEQDNMTLLYVKFPPTLRNTLTVGTLEIWKADSIYTTREIR